MRKIFKYPLQITDFQTIEVKSPAILLSVAEQNNQIMMYAIVDDLEYGIPVDVRIIGTGLPIKEDIENYKFLGTVKLEDGRLMFHVFVHHSDDFIGMDEKKQEDISVRIDKFVNMKEKRRFPEVIMA